LKHQSPQCSIHYERGARPSAMPCARQGAAIDRPAIGGIATLAIALLWMRLFPTLREVEKLE